MDVKQLHVMERLMIVKSSGTKFYSTIPLCSSRDECVKMED